jgi:hypothetical protein
MLVGMIKKRFHLRLGVLGGGRCLVLILESALVTAHVHHLLLLYVHNMYLCFSHSSYNKQRLFRDT